MNESGLIIHGDITPSDLLFFNDSQTNMSVFSFSSTRTDAESAPPEAPDLFIKICAECTRLVEQEAKQIPPQWDMSDLLRTLNEDLFVMPDLLRETYYDVMLRGPHSWLFMDVTNWIDLVNYAPQL